MFFVPIFERIFSITIVNLLFSFRETHISWFGIEFDAHLCVENHIIYYTDSANAAHIPYSVVAPARGYR